MQNWRANEIFSLKNNTLKYCVITVIAAHFILLYFLLLSFKLPRLVTDSGQKEFVIRVRLIQHQTPSVVKPVITTPTLPVVSESSVKTIAVQVQQSQQRIEQKEKLVVIPTRPAELAKKETNVEPSLQPVKDVSNEVSSSTHQSAQKNVDKNNTSANHEASNNSAQQHASTQDTSSSPSEQRVFKILNRRINYPVKARSMGVEGRVKVSYDVTTSGTVINIRILSETPAHLFSTTVQQDMKRWRYQTNSALNNQIVTIVFKLDGNVVIEN